MGGSSSKPILYLTDFETKLPLLTDKVVVITGCTSGTGLVAAKVMVRRGAAVVLLLNRPSERALLAEQAIRAELGVVPSTSSSSTTKSSTTTTIIETIPCDLQDFESVRAAAALIQSKGYTAIDVLCNNAGIMAMDDTATKDGYDVQMQTNHLSHFLLTKELFPLLQKAAELRGEARIVNHSSVARKGKLLDAQFLGKTGGSLGGNVGGAKWQRYHVRNTHTHTQKKSGAGLEREEHKEKKRQFHALTKKWKHTRHRNPRDSLRHA
jgi:NAD(P)-dependent dehydrogenase (short-subunit alcohol dehydrogenase family)